MSLLHEHITTSHVVPQTARELREVLVRLLIAVVLILLIGALSCTVAIARKGNRTRQQQLSASERLEAEQRLWELGYWAGTIDGILDPASRHALVAFQKVEGRRRTGTLDAVELTALRTASRPRARDGRYFHIEIDLERQVLFLIDPNGIVSRTLSVSTGNGELYFDHGQIHRARTPTGTFRVQRKINGWRLSSLGLLYYPCYIINGIAIHGSPSIPVFPASHGCIRIPMYAAKELSSFLSVGTEVEIYNDSEHLSRRLFRVQDGG